MYRTKLVRVFLTGVTASAHVCSAPHAASMHANSVGASAPSLGRAGGVGHESVAGRKSDISDTIDRACGCHCRRHQALATHAVHTPHDRRGRGQHNDTQTSKKVSWRLVPPGSAPTFSVPSQLLFEKPGNLCGKRFWSTVRYTSKAGASADAGPHVDAANVNEKVGLPMESLVGRRAGFPGVEACLLPLESVASLKHAVEGQDCRIDYPAPRSSLTFDGECLITTDEAWCGAGLFRSWERYARWLLLLL